MHMTQADARARAQAEDAAWRGDGADYDSAARRLVVDPAIRLQWSCYRSARRYRRTAGASAAADAHIATLRYALWLLLDIRRGEYQS